MTGKSFSVGIVGASGLVGAEILAILEQRNFPTSTVRLLASERSLGHTYVYKGAQVAVDVLQPQLLEDLDVCFFSAGSTVSAQFAPIAVANGALVVDNSSAFRQRADIPLVVPEVNGSLLDDPAQRLIANPNCATIQMVCALYPLHRKFTLKRVVASTYQAVSGAGRKATEELSAQVVGMYNSGKLKREVFPHQIAFNLIPQIASFDQNGYTQEENKIIFENRKIMGIPSLAITATAVRVPVFNSHSVSINAQFEQAFALEDVVSELRKAEGVSVIDDLSSNSYPMPLKATNRDEVFVGRIRRDESVENALNLFVVADNLRKGAALNAVQIAERYLLGAGKAGKAAR